MKSRLELFKKNQTHPINKSIYKKFTKADYDFCEKFILETDHLDNNQYASKVNRLFINGGEVPKNSTDIWAALTNAYEATIKKRRE